jgi:undecaprenyl-diphosphatase
MKGGRHQSGWLAGAGLAICSVALAGLSVGIARGRTKKLDRRWSRSWSGRQRAPERAIVVAQPSAVAVEAAVLALLPGLDLRERGSLLAAPLLAGLLGHLLKRSLPRSRPTRARFSAHGDESFPSTHTAGMAALASTAAFVARRHGAGRWVRAAAGLAVAAVAIERIHTRAHWPMDVVAGALLGLGAENLTRLALEHHLSADR